jgi:hypothetical protein
LIWNRLELIQHPPGKKQDFILGFMLTHINYYRADRDLWIIEKYVKRSFVKPSDLDQDTLDQVNIPIQPK